MNELVTRFAGFINKALSLVLIKQSDEVIDIDYYDDYYELELKEDRLTRYIEHSNYTQMRGELADRELIAELSATHKTWSDNNLAVQTGVRYSIARPLDYCKSMVGLRHNLESCRHNRVDLWGFLFSISIVSSKIRQFFLVHDDVNHLACVSSWSMASRTIRARHCGSLRWPS